MLADLVTNDSLPPKVLVVHRFTRDMLTHYTRILRYIQPQFVHVFVGGRIVESGGPELADELDANGYERFTQAVGA